MGLRIFWGLSGFICRSQFFCRRQKVHTWGLCLPKSSDLHFKRDVSHFFQGDVISSGQLAQSTRGPRAGVCRETNDLGPAAIMLRGYFGHWRMPRTFQFPSRMGERKSTFKTFPSPVEARSFFCFLSPGRWDRSRDQKSEDLGLNPSPASVLSASVFPSASGNGNAHLSATLK